MFKVNMQKIICLMLSLILTLGTLVVVPEIRDVRASSLSASFDVMQKDYPEFLQKLRDGGANEDQIKAFLNDLDTEVQQHGPLTESNINSIVYESLKIVLTKEEHRQIFKALLISFGTEIQYTIETHKLHPNMIPLRDAIKTSVLGVSVTGVNINLTTITMSVGAGPTTLIATLVPTNATNKNIVWSSDNPGVANVDASGNVTAVSVGTATLTVTTQDGGKIAHCTANVTQEESSNDLTQNTGAISTGINPPVKIPTTVGQTTNLQDIAGHWAEANIERLVASEAINGYPGGSFKPNNTITRAEFATVLIKAFKLSLQSGKIYNDTTNHWAGDYIATAAANGIVNGYSDTEFGANDFITREQMAVMIVKAIKLQKLADGKTFADSAQISDWARDAVATASTKNIISGYPDNTFNPKGNATRAEAVTVIVNALK